MIISEFLVPYHLVFCHKKQENLCVFVSLCEAIWVAGIARVRIKGNSRLWIKKVDRCYRLDVNTILKAS